MRQTYTKQKAKPAKRRPFHRILVAVDVSPQSQWATTSAAEIAGALGSDLALVHTFTVNPSPQETATPYATVQKERREMAQVLVQQHKAQCIPHIPCEVFCVEGVPAAGILQCAAEWGADLIVMGTHARGVLGRLLLGSTADAVVRRAKCPVMTVSQEPESAAAVTCHPAAAHMDDLKTRYLTF